MAVALVGAIVIPMPSGRAMTLLRSDGGDPKGALDIASIELDRTIYPDASGASNRFRFATYERFRPRTLGTDPSFVVAFASTGVQPLIDAR